MSALPSTANKSLKATISLAYTELYNEGKSAANDPEQYPSAQLHEKLDGRACPLCRAVNGKILAVGSREYRVWRQPSHINCRRFFSYIAADDPNGKPDFVEPSAELVRKHGHYHLDPEKHAELRIPAEPSGRHVIVRRVKNLETGKVETRLDWAPWWEQVPAEQRKLALQARATADAGELETLLGKLGISDPVEPEQARRAVLLGLKDRIEGWVTVAEKTPRGWMPAKMAAHSKPKERQPLPDDLIAKEVVRLHGEGGGGSTFSPLRGSLAGQAYYAVSLFSERTALIPGTVLTEADLLAFVEKNRDLLQAGALIGTWYDAEVDAIFLDITLVLRSKREAISEGKRYNQKAIFDLKRRVEIKTGGTGEAVEIDVPALKRIPESARKRFGWVPPSSG